LVLTALFLCAGAVSAASISDVGSTITVQNMINTDISNFIGQLNSQGGLIVKEVGGGHGNNNLINYYFFKLYQKK
jgi:hypothetical protein